MKMNQLWHGYQSQLMSYCWLMSCQSFLKSCYYLLNQQCLMMGLSPRKYISNIHLTKISKYCLLFRKISFQRAWSNCPKPFAICFRYLNQRCKGSLSCRELVKINSQNIIIDRKDCWVIIIKAYQSIAKCICLILNKINLQFLQSGKQLQAQQQLQHKEIIKMFSNFQCQRNPLSLLRIKQCLELISQILKFLRCLQYLL